ncbi:MAG: hypothetical protein O3A00_22340 [Planctomycetota bacterium]|nr:hypothetical protein [Planctomycetota bacterium]
MIANRKARQPSLASRSFLSSRIDHEMSLRRLRVSARVVADRVEFEFGRFFRLALCITSQRTQHQPSASHLGVVPRSHHIRRDLSTKWN